MRGWWLGLLCVACSAPASRTGPPASARAQDDVDVTDPSVVEPPSEVAKLEAVTRRAAARHSAGTVADAGPTPDSPAAVTDSDGDGITDDVDQCPFEPETVNGVNDEDGCPDPKLVIINRPEPSIVYRISFAHERARLDLKRWQDLLGTVVQALDQHPEIEKVACIGRAARGEKDPETLSQARAQAVCGWLEQHGIAPSRLEVVGWGTQQPLNYNRTRKERALNRSVEFQVRVLNGEKQQLRTGSVDPSGPDAPSGAK